MCFFSNITYGQYSFSEFPGRHPLCSGHASVSAAESCVSRRRRRLKVKQNKRKSSENPDDFFVYGKNATYNKAGKEGNSRLYYMYARPLFAEFETMLDEIGKL